MLFDSRFGFLSFALTTLLVLLPIQEALADAKSHCRPIVEAAINRAAPNEIEMMRAGEKASEECFRKYYNKNSSVGQAPKRAGIFEEKTLGEAFGDFLGFFVVGVILMFIPVIGPYIGALTMLIGVVVLGYALAMLYTELLIALAAVAGILVVLVSLVVIKGSFKKSDLGRDKKEKAKQKKKVETINITMASEGDIKGLLLKCINEDDHTEFVKYLEMLDANGMADMSPALIAETLNKLGRSKYLESLLKKGVNTDDSADIISSALQPLNLPAIRIMSRYKVNFNGCDSSIYINMIAQNLKKTRTKGQSPVMKKAEDGLRLILKSLTPDKIESLRNGLKDTLKRDLGDDYKFIEKLFTR